MQYLTDELLAPGAGGLLMVKKLSSSELEDLSQGIYAGRIQLDVSDEGLAFDVMSVLNPPPRTPRTWRNEFRERGQAPLPSSRQTHWFVQRETMYAPPTFYRVEYICPTCCLADPEQVSEASCVACMADARLDGEAARYEVEHDL